MKRKCLLSFCCATLFALAPAASDASRPDTDVVESYGDAVVATLRELVAFPTFHKEGISNAENPDFKAMTACLKRKADELGFDFHDYGAVVVFGMGESPRRLGLITHGDVQPAEASKWAKGPFTVDVESHPGRLIGRGTEDDKGPIAAALMAMRAVKDRRTPLTRRVELIISYTEESDWEPFMAFLAKTPPPDLNVGLDAEYPVVVAEKGWVSFSVVIRGEAASRRPSIRSFTGGALLSQVPEDAVAVVDGASEGIIATIRAACEADRAVKYTLEPHAGGSLLVRALGVSAHSSKPNEGVNAITHLAEILSAVRWHRTPASGAARFIHEMIGTGFYAEEFGHIAYSDAFMGPMTLSVGTLREGNGSAEIGINLRRPVGKDGRVLEAEIREAVAEWSRRSTVEAELADLLVYDPYDARQAPHVPILLDIFREYSGQADARPLSMGGGSHARLLPGGVNFGPVMPGHPYSGHSEHEYIEQDDLMLSLRMYTAMIERLAAR
ncbi:MAG: dipeptidase [Acidobacteriota bacterium]